MNYAAIYDRLIARASGRVLEGYSERHHVLPRCMGGSDAAENLVELTPEEHYVAHQLLVKMHPRHPGVTYAAMAMARRAVGRRSYGWLRRSYARSVSGLPKSPEHVAAMAACRIGHPVSEETRRKISATKKAAAVGRSKPKPAKQWSPEHRAKLAAAQRRRAPTPRTDEWKRKIAAGLRGKKRAPFSAEWRARMSASQKERARREGKVVR